MAELDVGKHCQASSCKQLDFLPIYCHRCGGTYCKDHSSVTNHDCSQCNVTKNNSEYTGPKSLPCFVDGCPNKELVPVVCEHCHNHFCLSHRHQQEHCCPFLPKEVAESKTAQHVRQILESKLLGTKRKTGAKSKKMAAKVALMKMKAHAVGNKNIADSEKLYLMIYAPLECTVKSKPILLSKKWSIGKVIDSAAELLGISNKNNVHDAKKLRLFDSEDGVLICEDMGRTLESLESDNIIINGGTLILEYVHENCDKIADTNSYTL